MKSTIKKLTWFIGLYMGSIIVVGGFVFAARWALGLQV